MVSATRNVLGGTRKETVTELIDVQREQLLNRELAARINAGPEGRSAGASLRTVCCVLASAVCYYVATQIAWALTFPDSKVSLFFPPQAVLLCILLLVPTRHWWAYVLAAASAHFLATQQAHWPPMYALTCEAFDAVKCVSAAAGIRILIKSPLKAITLRDAILFVLIAVVLVPFGTAFWGASFTVSYGFGTHYWIEWRNLGISNAVTTVVLVPAFLLGAHHLFVRRPRALSPRRVLEAALVGACTVALGIFVFDQNARGSQHFARSLIYADSSAHLGGAPLRPWWNQRLDVDHYVPGDLGNHARARPVPGPNPRRECAGTTAIPPGDRHSADAARGCHRRGKTLERSVA